MLQTKALAVDRKTAAQQEFVERLFASVVLSTLRQRNWLRAGELPRVRLVASLPDRVIYTLDMEELGGVSLEKWDDARFHAQMEAASGGRRVVVTTEGGIVVQIGKTAAAGKQLAARVALPMFAPLDLNTRPKAPYSIGFGIGSGGEIWAPLGALGHVMVSGSTGSGKSYFLRSLAYQLISLPRSQPVKLYLADRAGNVFTPLGAYRVPMLACDVAKSEEDIAGLLEQAVGEMRRRERLFDAETRHFPDKLEEYNRIQGVEVLPRAVVILDEVTVLVAATGGERGGIHQALMTLTAQGRKYGFTVVVAGQDFKATTFNTALTHQLSTRIAFKAGSANESRVVLGVDGAERLRGQGHGLLRQNGNLVEFQGFAVEKDVLVARCATIGTEPEAAGPKLAEWESRLVKYAVERLDGAFSQKALYEAFRDSGVTRYTIEKLSDDWLKSGWLVEERRGEDIGARRWVTPKLMTMAR